MNTRNDSSPARWIFCALVALLTVALQSTPASADPPSRVGRVSFLQGTVLFYMDRNEGWQPARTNHPVTSENSVWTDGGGLAEVRIGASAVRLDANTIVDFVRVADDRTDAFLQRGSLNIRTRNYGQSGYRESLAVETNGGRFVIDADGRYRIDVPQDASESRVTVFAGRARFEGADRNLVNVEPGNTIVVQHTQGLVSFRFEAARELEFDRWASARDSAWDEAHSRTVRERVVSTYMTGYEDLDRYGEWVDDREYGRIWAPRTVITGWAPYRYGSWSYVNPWGWTWVDDAPWGFAPFHYGRWVTVGSRWCWWPGSYHHRPAYAPALVAWYGKPGLSVSVSAGHSVGWFPLAPHEHFVPRYTNNTNYIRNVNYVTNNITVINPPARYANGVPGATFVNQAAFVQSKPVGNHLLRTDPAMIAAQAPQPTINLAPMRGAPVVANGNAPVYAGARGATKPGVLATPVLATPVPATPVSAPVGITKPMVMPAPVSVAAPSPSAAPAIGQPTPRPRYAPPAVARAEVAAQTVYKPPAIATNPVAVQAAQPPVDTPPRARRVRPMQNPEQVQRGEATRQMVSPVASAPGAAVNAAPVPRGEAPAHKPQQAHPRVEAEQDKPHHREGREGRIKPGVAQQ